MFNHRPEENNVLKGRNGSSSIPRNQAVTDMLFIGCLWWAGVLIVNPVGDFPLNDDWSFGLAVNHFIETGTFHPLGWTSMPLITDVLWGSLFCIPAGFSFTALRLSTLTLSMLGVFGCYLLMRELHRPRREAVIVALTLGFNPIYYALSHTFMTDVPFTAITILSAFFFARSLRTGSDFDLLIGTTLAIAATLSRQLGIAIPIAFALSFMMTRGFKGLNPLRAAVPFILCLAALIVLQSWLQQSGGLPEMYHSKTEDLLRTLTNPKALIWSLTKNTYVGFLYLGWFLLPVLILGVANIFRSHGGRTIAIFSSALVVMAAGDAAVLLYGRSALMPISGNIVTTSGIGPLTLRDTFVLGLRNLPTLPVGFWVAVTALGLLGAALLIVTLAICLTNLARRPRREVSGEQAVGIFLLLSAVIYLLPLYASNFIDRYLVLTVPLLAGGFVALSGHSRLAKAGMGSLTSGAAVILAALSLFAICGTRDYLEWNRGRWQLLHHLMEDMHVGPKEIDGGFEYNGFYLYNPKSGSGPQKSWWWVQEDTYQIAFGSIPGYTVIKEYNYTRWMPPSAGKVVALKRNPQTP